MGISKRVARASALALALAVAAPAAAMAGGNEYPTFFTAFKYKLDSDQATFKGAIDSTKGNCVGDRKVVLYRKKNGDKKKLGGDHTNSKGKFKIDLGQGAPKNGTYFSEVNQTKIGNSGNKNTCLKQKSPLLKLSS